MALPNKRLVLLFLLIILLILFSFLSYFFFFSQKNLTPKTKTLPPITDTNKIPCPVPKEWCKDGKTIDSGNISYVGYVLSSNTPLLSVLDGVVRVGGSGGGKYKIKGHPVVFLENPNGVTFTYEFFGTYATPSAALVPVGTELGRIDVSLGNFSPFYDVNFIFGMEKDNKRVPLKTTDIEQ